MTKSVDQKRKLMLYFKKKVIFHAVQTGYKEKIIPFISRWGEECISSGGALARQVQGPEFNLWYC
jgi:hypothetical protein